MGGTDSDNDDDEAAYMPHATLSLLLPSPLFFLGKDVFPSTRWHATHMLSHSIPFCPALIIEGGISLTTRQRATPHAA